MTDRTPLNENLLDNDVDGANTANDLYHAAIDRLVELARTAENAEASAANYPGDVGAWNARCNRHAYETAAELVAFIFAGPPSTIHTTVRMHLAAPKSL